MKNEELYDPLLEKFSGKFKSETPITIDVEERCALKTKAYWIKLKKGKENKKLKGLTKAAFWNFEFALYLNCSNDKLSEEDKLLIRW